MAEEERKPQIEPVESAVDAELEADVQRGTRPSTDANFWIVLATGIIGTALTSFGASFFQNSPNPGLNYFDGIINRRGPVQFGELIMSFMVAAILVLKSRILKSQQKIVASNPIPVTLDFNDDAQLSDLREQVRKRDEYSWSILFNRIDRAITLWLYSKDVGRVSTWASAESSRDSSSSDSTYSLTRVLIWAIPIMGFIGTVQGLGAAVAGFGVLGGAADVSVIKQAIGQVTVGLGVAFDTTLLALMLTTFLMFPMTSIQRREEDLFGELDVYLDDAFLARLPQQSNAQPIVIENLEESIEAAFRRYIPDPDRYDEVFTRSIDKAAGAVEEKFAGLAKNYESTLRDITTHLGQQLKAVGDSIEARLDGVVAKLQLQDQVVLEARRKIGEEEVERFRSVIGEINAAAERVATGYRTAAEGMVQTLNDTANRTAKMGEDLSDRMKHVAGLASGIQEMLRIEQAIEKTMEGISKSDSFQQTLLDLRKHLDVTNAFCERMSKPRVITLREEAAK